MNGIVDQLTEKDEPHQGIQVWPVPRPSQPVLMVSNPSGQWTMVSAPPEIDSLSMRPSQSPLEVHNYPPISPKPYSLPTNRSYSVPEIRAQIHQPCFPSSNSAPLMANHFQPSVTALSTFTHPSSLMGSPNHCINHGASCGLAPSSIESRGCSTDQSIGPRTPKNDGQSLEPAKYKTSMCRYYRQGKLCPFGSACVYAHGKSELRTSRENSAAVFSINKLMANLMIRNGPQAAQQVLRPLRSRQPADGGGQTEIEFVADPNAKLDEILQKLSQSPHPASFLHHPSGVGGYPQMPMDMIAPF